MGNNLNTPRFRVVLDGRDPFEVRVTQGAQTQWDMERHLRSWPAADNLNLWSSYVAFASAKQAKLIDTTMPWEAWYPSVVLLEFLGSDEVEAHPPVVERDLLLSSP